ncbi:MAG: hypothetical protein KC561_12450, partial [Myxococcales bacterium]|nr:hypothetical protein [Myxococcales bacterium]
GSLSLGDYVTANNMTLSVGNGGGVSATVNGAELRVGETVIGTVNCTLSSGGITATGTIQASQITIGAGLTVDAGSLTVSVDSNGGVTGNGTLTLGIAGVGTLTLQAQLQNETVTGSATLNLPQPIEIAAGVSVVSVSVNGDFSKDGFRLSGRAGIKARDWAEAEITASFNYPDKNWNASGTIRQTQPFNVGGMEVTGAELTVSLVDNVLGEVSARANWSYSQWSGDVTGTYDIANHSVSGQGTVTLNGELALGSSGVSVSTANGRAKLEGNALTQVTGDATGKIPYENQPTFEVSVNDLVLDVPNSSFSGSGRATLSRALTVSSGDTTIYLDSGEFQLGVQSNNLESAGFTNVAFRVSTPINGQTMELGGSLTTGEWRNGEVTAKVDVSLSQSLTFGIGSGSATVNSGTLELDLQANRLERVGLKNVNVNATIPVGEQTLALRGDISEGAIVGTAVDFDGTMTLEQALSFSAGSVTGSLTSGSVRAKVTQNTLDFVELQGVEATAQVLAGLRLGGRLEQGRIDGNGKITMDASIANTAPFSVTFGTVGGATLKTGGTFKLKIDESVFTQATLESVEVDATVPVKDQTLALNGTMRSGKVDADGLVGFDGDISISRPLRVAFGEGDKHSLSVTSGSVNVKVEASSFSYATLQNLNMGVDVQVKEGSVLALNGGLSGKIDGTGNVDLDGSIGVQRPFTYRFGDGDKHSFNLSSGNVTLKVTASEFVHADLTEVQATADIEVKEGKKLNLSGSLSGKVNGDGTVDVESDIGLSAPF